MGTDLSVVNAARVSMDKESFYPPIKVEYGERVVYVRDIGEFGPDIGDTGVIERVEESHFYVRTDHHAVFWTTVADVRAPLPDKDSRLLAYLAREKHWTPFAHATVSLRVKAPIFVARQLDKHQIGLVKNEVSRRYVDSEPEFYTPDAWRRRAPHIKQGSSDETAKDMVFFGTSECWVAPVAQLYASQCESALALYNSMLMADICPEQARMVLPQSMLTEWIWTGTLAAWARVCNLRLDKHTQQETRDIAAMISDIIRPLFPESWAVLVPQSENTNAPS